MKLHSKALKTTGMVFLALGAALGIYHICQTGHSNATDLKVPASSLLIGAGMILTMLSKKKKTAGFSKPRSKASKHLKNRTFGAAKGYFTSSPDFEAPLEDFKDYE
jgi:hypothetical protein